MATSTFYDNIVIEKEAGERLAKILREPPLPFPEKSSEITEASEEQLKRFFYNLEKRSSGTRSEK